MADVNVTTLDKLINPQVMADMIIEKLEKKIQVIKYAKVDTTLQGQAGDTVTVPRTAYIGDAVEVAEGEEIPMRTLSTDSDPYTIKMAGVGVRITDKAALSGYGNPVGTATNQLATSIKSKIDADAMAELLKAKTVYDGSAAIIGYAPIVNAVDLFDEEVISDKVMFVNPKQVTQLRLDPEFISKEKYGNDVMQTGEIGMVGTARIVPSKRVEKDESGNYLCPIVKLDNDTETEDDAPALTYYIKRNTNVEKDRIVNKRTTEVSADQMYTVALTNEAKVVICKVKAAAVPTV
jgi:N4-gp56 family major capsid protein